MGWCFLLCACLFNTGSSLTYQAANRLTLGLLAWPAFSRCVSWLPPQTWHHSHLNPSHSRFSHSAPILSLGPHAVLHIREPCVANATGGPTGIEKTLKSTHLPTGPLHSQTGRWIPANCKKNLNLEVFKKLTPSP